MPSLTDQILNLWELRFNQKNERCLNELPSLKQAAGIPLGPVADAKLEDWVRDLLACDSTREERTLVLLLNASLLRVQGRGRESARWIDVVVTVAAEHGLSNFFTRFEQGIAYFAHGDSHSALEFFVQAERGAPRLVFQLAAAVNALLCLENLGLPHGETLTRARELANQGQDSGESARAQLLAFDLRQAFRRGEFSQFHGSETRKLNQAEYFRLWVRQLPYHRAHSPLSEADYQPFGENRDFFYQNAFRLRTLQGALHPADLETLKPSEFAHRFYLWTWKWLENPGRFPVNKAISVVARSKTLANVAFLDRESQVMLRNALLWLSLFDPSSAPRISSLIEELSLPDASLFPLFALESDLIYALLSLRDSSPQNPGQESDDARFALEASALWKNPDLHFSELFSFVVDGKNPPDSLRLLGENLRALMRSSHPGGRAQILVDVARNRVIDSRNSEQLISEPMARALDLLNEKGSVSIDAFVLECFGIRTYDSLIHQTKVHNLLQRLKRLCPNELRFRTKAGMVLAEGSWKSFEIVRPTEVTRKLIDSADWRATTRQKPVDDIRPQPRPVKMQSVRWSGVLSRAEIEKRIQRPRSTTNRMIANWEKRGLIQREGSGRAIAYRWNGANS